MDKMSVVNILKRCSDKKTERERERERERESDIITSVFIYCGLVTLSTNLTVSKISV